MDIKFIRESPEQFDNGLIARGMKPQSASIIAIDIELLQQQQKLQELQARRNEIARQVGQLKSRGEDSTHIVAEAEQLKSAIPSIEARTLELQEQLHNILALIPNHPAQDVPRGKDADSNVEVRNYGKPPVFNFTPKHHYELGEQLGQMDFKTAAAMSGSRFVILKKDLARLERALANFMLDIHTNEFGYTEISPPTLVKDEAMFGVGQLPKFDEESFRTREGLRLIPTSEVSLTNMVANTIIPELELPLRFTAYTPCYRSEAGSAGQDTRGMIRLHQFHKVEMVSITRPHDSVEEHERMTSCAEEILNRLELPYRVMALCTGDLGFAAAKTYDIEVWLPAQQRYREISSCSNCTDFQARRLKARYKDYTSQKNYFVHTLNGSGLPIGRTIVAIMENYQNADGSIAIPDNLQQYMGGKKFINL